MSKLFTGSKYIYFLYYFFPLLIGQMEINGTPPKSYFNKISLHLLKYDFGVPFTCNVHTLVKSTSKMLLSTVQSKHTSLQ